MGYVFIQLHIPHVIWPTMDYSQLIEPIFTHTETVVPFCVFLDFNFIVHFINIWSVQEAVQTAVQAIDFIKSIPNCVPGSVAHLNYSLYYKILIQKFTEFTISLMLHRKFGVFTVFNESAVFLDL